jgi:UDP-glucose 4-epimerase
VYNIASEQETSLRGLAEALLRTMGSEAHIEFGPERQVNGVTRRLASTAAARHDLGWRSTVGLDEGLRRLVDWWLVERETDAELSGVV